MSWEVRGGRAYDYRGRRDGGRVVKEYVGAGPAADLIARHDALSRDQRQAEAGALRRTVADLASLDSLADAVARAASYHRHNRGRGRPAVPAPPKTPPPKSDRPTDALAVVRRAEAGDAAALPALRELLKRPELVDGLGGNLARSASETLLTAFAGTNLHAKEVVSAKMAALRAELGGPDPTPVERLLAERAVCCWLYLYHLEHTYSAQKSMSFALAQHYQRSIDRAHKRYLSSLKALADVRRLAGPTVQVNIARKQVNVAGGPPPG